MTSISCLRLRKEWGTAPLCENILVDVTVQPVPLLLLLLQGKVDLLTGRALVHLASSRSSALGT